MVLKSQTQCRPAGQKVSGPRQPASLTSEYAFAGGGRGVPWADRATRVAIATAKNERAKSRFRIVSPIGQRSMIRDCARLGSSRSAEIVVPYSGTTCIVAVPGTGPGIGTGAGPAD